MLHYPCTASTFASGVGLAVAAVSSVLAADALQTTRVKSSGVGQLAAAYVAGFVAFKVVTLVFALFLGGVSMTLAPMLVAKQFLRDGAILVALYAFYRVLIVAGVPAPSRAATA